MVPLERAIVVSYTLFIVTITLSLTIRPHFAIECQNFRVFLLEKIRDVGILYVVNVTDRQTAGQIDVVAISRSA